MTLFKTLLRSIYVVDGVNGEFLADLTRPIPYATSNSEVRSGDLATIPTGRCVDVAVALGVNKGVQA